MKLNNKGFAHTLVFAAIIVIVAVVGTYFLVSSHADPAPTPATTTTPSASTTGNGAPNGAHYNLEIIGVAKDKTGTYTSGNRIFVPLESTCKINLTMGDFSVTDGNCSDGSAAGFQLPNPDPTGTGVTTYSVWARPLGKPGGKATATTCATDPTTTEQVCSLESTAFVRTKGKSSFTNVSKGFLTVLVDTDGDSTTPPVRLSIFDTQLQDYFWNYDNNGLKHLQLRFYQN